MDINQLLPADLEQKLYELAHKSYEIEKRWIAAQENYDIIEDNKKSKFASIVEVQEGKTTAEKERLALINADWNQYLSALSQSRKMARELRVERDNILRLWETCRSIMSSKNAERRLG